MDRIHHVAIFTARYDDTVAFYRDVFDADIPDRCGQPSVVRIGGVTLHVFEEPSIAAGWAPAHVHHVALEASDVAEFAAIRTRLVARGACDGQVIDFRVGAHVSLLATDPDGAMLEVVVAVEDRSALPFAVEQHA